ncbi:MAG TPA: dihydroorotate dehydrogenase-like protein [Pyrinomonadaceae bacterium]|nr:dihydroorotate dehydrogenase-like protein [Pyrinomonadaceae bacterium]
MNLATTYMGLTLPHPLVVGAGPLTEDLGIVRQLEDEGAAALVLSSLYEEEFISDHVSAFISPPNGDSSSKATSFLPDSEVTSRPDEYLNHLRSVKQAVNVPVIASLNASTLGGWISYARLIEQAGANAIELQLYHSASDPNVCAAEAERQMIQIVKQVKEELRIPVAVKLSPLFTAFANFAMQVDAAGADGIVLFTRFYKIDFNVVELKVFRRVELSSSSDLDLRLRGAAVLSGRVKASLGITGGIHTALDVIKATMAGAHIVQVVSTLMRYGPRCLRNIRTELRAWMLANEWESLEELRGIMSFQKIPDPANYERETFRRMFGSLLDKTY